MEALSKQKVVDLVEKELGKYRDIVVVLIDPDYIRFADEYWEIPVFPRPRPDWDFKYYEVLSRAEDALQEEFGLKINLMPTRDPEEEVG